MSVFMTLRIALKALARNKMRTALTMLGMIIGVAAVIAMVALGSGAQAQIEEQIKQSGTNLIMVNAGNFSAGVGLGGQRQQRRCRPLQGVTGRVESSRCQVSSSTRKKGRWDASSENSRPYSRSFTRTRWPAARGCCASVWAGT